MPAKPGKTSPKTGLGSVLKALFQQPDPAMLHGFAAGRPLPAATATGADNTSETHSAPTCRLTGCRHCE
ncbi:MAG: hypothetical protein HC779_08835 [Phyllobacteriaceae bacterium]|nr:hypothetical protein [Phyllobacteriaceae bacterium]